MKKRVLLISIIIIPFLLSGCSFFTDIGNEAYKNTIFCFKKEKIMDDSLFTFVNKLIENNKTYDAIIKNSKFYDSVFGYTQFWGIYSDFLSLCSENGYKIIDSYSFKIEDQKFDYYYGHIVYPEENSEEGKKLKRIANIIIYPNNTRKSESGNFIFKYYQRKDETWYLAFMGFERVLLQK